MAVPLSALAALFLRLGATAFGGPAAHLAIMHVEVVRRRGWLSDADFADLIAATNLIPGPNSTEMAMYVGRKAAGLRGLLVAGACFILPAAVLVALIAAAYVRYGRTPDARGLLSGITPIVLAIIAQAIWRLGRSALRTSATFLVALVSLVLSLAGVHELWLLLSAGIVMVAIGAAASWTNAVLLLPHVTPTTTHVEPTTVSLGGLALFFVKVGSILFGSGYVLIAFLRADLVERWQWLSERQLLDAVAVGQITPGPVLTTATFIGYVLAGWPGAAVSTVAIFLPAFAFTSLTYSFISRLRESATLGAFLDGVVAASLGLMSALALSLAATTLRDPLSVALFAGAAFGLLGWNLNSTWLIAAGGMAGLVRARL
jgi:chromate transporter